MHIYTNLMLHTPVLFDGGLTNTDLKGYNSNDLGDIIKQMTNAVATWGGYLIVLIGALLIVYTAVMVAQKFLSGPQSPGGQTSWIKIVACLVIGGAMTFGGFSMLMNVGAIGKNSVTQASGVQSTNDATSIDKALSQQGDNLKKDNGAAAASGESSGG